jgi:ABC-type sugar transport system permease subunit
VQDFGGIYLLTAGGPGTSTYVPGLELYFNTTQFGRYGYACALGLVLFMFTLAGTMLNMKMKTNTNE